MADLKDFLPFYYLGKGVREIIRLGFKQLQEFKIGQMGESEIFLDINAGVAEKKEVYRRLLFFMEYLNSKGKVQEITKISLKILFSPNPILYFGKRSVFMDLLVAFRPGTFDIDYRYNPMDGWAWTDLVGYINGNEIKFSMFQEKLKATIDKLKNQNKEKCYIFGTGPSLEKAVERNWGDGYRVVCNTIVRDEELWNYISPDFIVAGDAIYHFGMSEIAQSFRSDLRKRLKTKPALFLYPSQFHPIVQNEFCQFEEYLVPIPIGWYRRVDIDLTQTFRLPALGNILPLLMLPLACTLSREVYLWGFDGRAPTDRLFWGNSPKHSYPEYLNELQTAHPAFFNVNVPASNPTKYVRKVHGEQLDGLLRKAEKRGWNFIMMHPSWTPALNKRYIENNENSIYP